MVAIPLSVLALAAGVYLLVKVKREFLGGAFEILAWLVIVLALTSVGFAGFKALRHCGGGQCGNKPQCHVEKRVTIMNDGMGHCSMDSSMTMGCCKMEGDSVVMEPAMCEKMMGKEACEAMRAQRGRCIVSKDECMTMCHAAGKPCCAQKTEAQCTKKCEGEKKECCQKKM